MKADNLQPTAYRRLVRIVIIVGTITFLGGGLWLVAGGGIAGSPVDGAFRVENRTTGGNYWEFWILWVVVAGPIALLPCALLERFCPRAGAAAMVVAAIFVAEAGIRSGRNDWGYAGTDALIVIWCIATPMFLLAVSLLALGAGRMRRQVAIVGIFAMTLLEVGLSVQFVQEHDYWNANCPKQMNKK
jgi:hypothetical protein